MRALSSARGTVRITGRIALPLLALAIVGVAAPQARAAETLHLTTPYPAVVVSPGSKVSFDLAVKSSTAGRVDLGITGVPTGWTATLQGGGFVVSAVETDGRDPTSVRLDVSVPASATGATHLTVTATRLGQSVALGLDIRVEAAAGGEVTLTTAVPSLKDTADATFNFNLTIKNDTPQDLTFVVNATGPTGWTIDAALSGQTQAASAIVKAGTRPR